MSKSNKDKGMLAIGAAVTFCGLTLYAADRVLNYLFRDVDKERIREAEEDEPDMIEGETIDEDEPEDGWDDEPEDD